MVHVGVLSPVTGGFYFGEVLAGAVREIADAGGRVTLLQTLDAGRTAESFTSAPRVRAPAGWASLDGFIAIAWAADAEHLRQLRDAGKPVVLISNDIELDATTVVVDNEDCVRAAVDHLVDHGHTAIAFVGNTGQTDMMERYTTCRDHAASRGIRFRYITAIDHIEAGGRSAAPAFQQAFTDGFTGVIAATDRVALGLIDALVEHGIDVPEDVAVIGFDDVEAGWTHEPPLATINQEFGAQGEFAATLLLAELAGDTPPHERHVVPARFIPRRTCGCPPGASTRSVEGERIGAALAESVLAHLGLAGTGASADHTPDEVDLGALDAVISAGLAPLRNRPISPERRRALLETSLRTIRTRASELTAAGPDVGALIEHCELRIADLFAHTQAASAQDRIDRLTTSLAEQYEIGMGLLGDIETDPSDLRWMKHLPVRAGLVGLWEGSPDRGLLRVHGVYDPSRTLTDLQDTVIGFDEFPPRALSDVPGAGPDEVTYVVPIRGTTGDHGTLAVMGAIDTEYGAGRATYNHWAALLGAALRETRLLEEVRSSEERYAHAAQASKDGLWECDLTTDEMYFSERCQELLGTGPAPDRGTWTDVVHPDDRDEVIRALTEASSTAGHPVEVEFRVGTGDDDERWRLLRALGVAGTDRVERLVGSLSDIEQRKQLEDQLRQAALYDEVTGLPNRRLFLDRLGWAIGQTKRAGGAEFAVVFLDLDHFKDVNDTLGHIVGDELLAEVGKRLRADLRSVDTAARFGGDEFAVLLFDLDLAAVQRIVARIQERLAAPITLGEYEVAVTASVGIATSRTGYTDPEDVLRDADIAMYQAKEAERGTACVFDPSMLGQATDRLTTQTELRVALTDEQFRVHYQPIVALDGSGLTRFEALVRWEHPERGLLPPAQFLPLMAETGMVVSLGRWIVDTVCSQIARWREDWTGELTVSVNLSHREFWSPELVTMVTEALARHRVPPSCLILEISESVAIADPDGAREVLTALRDVGVHVHIDDFGTAQSSVLALRNLPVDALKIDRSFVREIDVDDRTSELVRIVVGMGLTLGMDVVAEGVETDAQAGQLQSMGCRTAQGWLYAQALPGDDAGALLGKKLLPVTDEQHRA